MALSRASAIHRRTSRWNIVFLNFLSQLLRGTVPLALPP
jgi:hypothetical protein